MKKYIIATLTALVVALPVLAAVVPGGNDFPTDVEQCKKGGWETYDGLFKNQGDCVSFVVTEGRNAPDGPAVQ